MVIDEKSGKAGFKTVEVKDNSPDKKHFVIHFKNKDGSIDKVNVSEKTFNKFRFKFIAKTTLFKTETSTREGTVDKVIQKLRAWAFNDGTEPEPDVPFAPKSDEEGDPNGKFSRDDSDVPIKEGDLTPNGKTNSKTEEKKNYSIVYTKQNGSKDTISTITGDTTQMKENITNSDSRNKIEGVIETKEFH